MIRLPPLDPPPFEQPNGTRAIANPIPINKEYRKAARMIYYLHCDPGPSKPVTV
jgi:hypothetical protein